MSNRCAGALLLSLSIAVAGTACSDPADPRVPPSQVVLPPDLDQAYRIDAARLALREVSTRTDLKREPPEIPDELQQSIYNALVRVHVSSHPARDRVVELGIHTFPRPDVFEVIVNVSPDAPWAAAWRSSRARTGYQPLDELVDRYGLTIERYYYWSIGEYAVVRSAGPINAAGLARLLDGVPGVGMAEPNGWGGDGNDITARRDGDGWRLRYLLKWGDCPAGCINAHYWEFRVRASGTVSYMGEGGDSSE